MQLPVSSFNKNSNARMVQSKFISTTTAPKIGGTVQNKFLNSQFLKNLFNSPASTVRQVNSQQKPIENKNTKGEKQNLTNINIPNVPKFNSNIFQKKEKMIKLGTKKRGIEHKTFQPITRTQSTQPHQQRFFRNTSSKRNIPMNPTNRMVANKIPTKNLQYKNTTFQGKKQTLISQRQPLKTNTLLKNQARALFLSSTGKNNKNLMKRTQNQVKNNNFKLNSNTTIQSNQSANMGLIKLDPVSQMLLQNPSLASNPAFLNLLRLSVLTKNLQNVNQQCVQASRNANTKVNQPIRTGNKQKQPPKRTN